MHVKKTIQTGAPQKSNMLQSVIVRATQINLIRGVLTTECTLFHMYEKFC